jgi:rhodanese-related sulfurtransferase
MDPRVAFEQRDDLVFLDIREPWEWQAGRIAYAVHVPMSELPARVDELGSDRPVVCVCRTGARSDKVAAWLRAQGYDAHNLDGGLADWATSGLPFDGEVV